MSYFAVGPSMPQKTLQFYDCQNMVESCKITCHSPFRLVKFHEIHWNPLSNTPKKIPALCQGARESDGKKILCLGPLLATPRAPQLCLEEPPQQPGESVPGGGGCSLGAIFIQFQHTKTPTTPQKAQKKVKKHDSIMFPSQDISSFRTATCNMSFSWLMARIPSISYQPFGHHPLKFPQPMHWSKARGTPWRPEPPWCDQDAGAVVPSGKRLHNYGKIHHFSWENPL